MRVSFGRMFYSIWKIGKPRFTSWLTVLGSLLVYRVTFFCLFGFCKFEPTIFVRYQVFFGVSSHNFFFIFSPFARSCRQDLQDVKCFFGIPSHNFFFIFSAFARSCRQDLRDGKCDATIHANWWGQSGQRTGAYVKTYHGKQGTMGIQILG